MIKPIDISQIDTTKKVYFECSNCGTKSILTFTNRIINTDNETDLEELRDERCPNCNSVLGDEKET